MLRILYACLFEQHDLRLVALAAVVCLLGCFTAINLFADAQAATGRRRHIWHAAAATVFGAGVWTTHFIAELAYRPGIPIGYETDLTLLSIAVAIIVTWAGMWLALSPAPRYVGGAIIGGAVGAMHYTGMAALRAPADLVWDPMMVALSVVIGALFAAAAMEVLGRKPTIGHRIGAVLSLVLAIVALHFTGMAALTLTLNPAIAMPQEVIAPDLLAIAVAAGTALIITLGLAGSFVENRLAQRAIEENERLQRRIEERTAELRHVQDELVRKEKLSVLGQLTATVAHELRNPLSAIANTVYMLRQQAAEDSGLDRPIARIERSISRCERIINDLLDFTQMRRLDTTQVEIDAWLGELLDTQKLGAGIQLERRFAAPAFAMSIDIERMQRVILNVIENAVHAMSEPRGDGRSPRITVATRGGAAHLEILIEDNGPGIPADILPQVFEPLFSTKSFGTGLGLPMVKQIMEQHGGAISIASRPQSGTQVTLRLPRRQPMEMAA